MNEFECTTLISSPLAMHAKENTFKTKQTLFLSYLVSMVLWLHGGKISFFGFGVLRKAGGKMVLINIEC